MKSLYPIIFGAVFALTSLGVSAQTSSSTPDASSDTGASSQTPASKKILRLENRQLSKVVQRTLAKTKGLTDTHIIPFAKYKSGDVILAGFITDSTQEQIAIDVARKVPNVKSVESKLTLVEEGH
ncbi:BON domain-containing protein [Paraburkholderia sediminicola]|uniref:BON domain-containing protein n=1 Tax=Paraburkholderia sediminicola TaxID=458836 RepID=UPI0038B7DD68